MCCPGQKKTAELHLFSLKKKKKSKRKSFLMKFNIAQGWLHSEKAISLRLHIKKQLFSKPCGTLSRFPALHSISVISCFKKKKMKSRLYSRTCVMQAVRLTYVTHPASWQAPRSGWGHWGRKSWLLGRWTDKQCWGRVRRLCASPAWPGPPPFARCCPLIGWGEGVICHHPKIPIYFLWTWFKYKNTMRQLTASHLKV